VGTGAAEAPAVVRRPNPRESVFVIGRDSESPYFSELTTVTHVGVAARTFSLAAMSESQFPYEGGLVMAVSDAAVVGQYVGSKASISQGLVSYCCSVEITAKGIPTLSLVEHLASKFPMLSPTSWTEDVVEEMALHSSIALNNRGEPTNSGNLPLAGVGDSAACLALRTRLRELQVPHSECSGVLQGRQSNSVMVDLAWKFGLTSYLRAGNGVSFPAKSKAYADFFEAIVGAAYLCETRDAFMAFCEAAELVPRAAIDRTASYSS